MRKALFPVMLALCATPAAAQRASTPASPSAAETQAHDPARLAIASEVVAALVPEGVYARMMRDQMPMLADAMLAEMMTMKASDVEPGAGDATLAETAKKADPAFEERTRISMRVLYEEMGTLMAEMEPEVRRALANSFARRFTAEQLADMDRFFKTPSGKAFADNYLLMFADPEMAKSMSAMAPRIMQAMPEIMKKVEAATAHLPPVPTPEEETE